MIQLIGIKNDVYQEEIGGDFLDHLSHAVVATFDFEEDARKYAENVRLKEPKRRAFDTPQVFKNGILLQDCVDYDIRGLEQLNKKL